MAKKAKASKGRKVSKVKTKRKGNTRRTPSVAASDSSISVTDGAMKDVFRSAFLKREH